MMGHIKLSTDSACAQAPNVVTPNADGINDVFFVSTKNITSMQTSVHRLSGEVVFHSTSLWPSWDGLDSTDLGRYRVVVQATSTSGITLSGSSYLDLLDYDANMCLQHAGTPVTGDQIDPRICGVTYATNDIFCR